MGRVRYKRLLLVLDHLLGLILGILRHQREEEGRGSAGYGHCLRSRSKGPRAVRRSMKMGLVGRDIELTGLRYCRQKPCRNLLERVRWTRKVR